MNNLIEGRKEGLTGALVIIEKSSSLTEAKVEIEARLLELETSCDYCGSFEIEFDNNVFRCMNCGRAFYEEDRIREEEEDA